MPTWGSETMRALLDALFAESALGICFLDQQLRCVYMNTALAEMGGHTVQEFIGRTLVEARPQVDASVGDYLRHVVATGRALNGLRVTNGTRFWTANYYPVLAPDGTAVGIGAVLADDTERDRAEQLLRDSEEQYRSLVELSPDGIAIMEGERIAYVNRAGAAILGASDAAQLIDHPVWDFVTPERLALGRATLRGVATTRQARSFDATIRRCDGSEAIVSVRSVAFDQAGHPAVQSIFRDVTARRAEQREHDRAREDLKRARDELEVRIAERTASLEEANERLRLEAAERASAERQLRVAERLAAIGTFGAGVAHEINNPLAAIVATAQLGRALNADGERHTEVDSVLVRIVDEAHRAGEIVKGVLRFAREGIGDRWPLDVNEVARRLRGSGRLEGVLQGCRLRTRLARRLPCVVMNPTELEQILLNLLNNAAQAGAQEVGLRTDASAGRIRIVVRDDGRGIDPHDLERIFDPFFTTRPEEGTGLGLSIVHGIVARYEGDIRVRSRLGRGTSFTVQLPSASREARA
jgi:PAS domain S-box-containing protein